MPTTLREKVIVVPLSHALSITSCVLSVLRSFLIAVVLLTAVRGVVVVCVVTTGLISVTVGELRDEVDERDGSHWVVLGLGSVRR
jgi:hypothetical protein